MADLVVTCVHGSLMKMLSLVRIVVCGPPWFGARKYLDTSRGPGVTVCQHIGLFWQHLLAVVLIVMLVEIDEFENPSCLKSVRSRDLLLRVASFGVTSIVDFEKPAGVTR